MLHGALNVCTTKKQTASNISVAEMENVAMDLWTVVRFCEIIRNENLSEMVGEAPIEDRMREKRLRWYGHVYCRSADAVVFLFLIMAMW